MDEIVKYLSEIQKEFETGRARTFISSRDKKTF